jgi:hypothetical protein
VNSVAATLQNLMEQKFENSAENPAVDDASDRGNASIDIIKTSFNHNSERINRTLTICAGTESKISTANSIFNQLYEITMDLSTKITSQISQVPFSNAWLTSIPEFQSESINYSTQPNIH